MNLAKKEVFNNILHFDIFLHLKYRLMKCQNIYNYCTIWVSLEVKKKKCWAANNICKTLSMWPYVGCTAACLLYEPNRCSNHKCNLLPTALLLLFCMIQSHHSTDCVHIYNNILLIKVSLVLFVALQFYKLSFLSWTSQWVIQLRNTQSWCQSTQLNSIF